ncbi:MAG: hypothetical protein ACR2N4_11015, partial [Jatrophihabitans sp.]
SGRRPIVVEQALVISVQREKQTDGAGERSSNDGVSRRNFIRSGGTLGLGIVAAAGASLARPVTAEAATPPTQVDWRYCQACAALKYSNSTTFNPGACCEYNSNNGRYNGAHTPGSRDYYLPTTASEWPGQSGWRYCGKCGVLYWPGTPRYDAVTPTGAGHCSWDAAGHSGTSYNYRVPYTAVLSAGTGYQAGWRWCSRCGALVWGASTADPYCGGIIGQKHRVSGYNYVVPYL